jgi:hypothetical protein
MLSDQFEEHRLNSMSIHYVSSVPATTEGALSMSFRNDVGTSTDMVGRDEFAHSASAQSFVEGTVWTDLSMEVRAEDAFSKYFDVPSDSVRTQAQGFITVEAASELAASTTYGNLFLMYDFSFYGEALDYDVEEVENAALDIYWDPAVGYTYIDQGENVVFTDDGASPFPIYTWTAGPTVLNSTDYMFYGVVTAATGAWVTANSKGLYWETTSRPSTGFSNGGTQFAVGQCFWMRFAHSAGDFTTTSIYTKMTGAGGFMDNGVNGGHGDGQLFWSQDTTSGGTAGTLSISGRLWKISDIP